MHSLILALLLAPLVASVAFVLQDGLRSGIPRLEIDASVMELPTPVWCGDCLRLGVSSALDGDRAFLGDDGRRDGPPHAGMVIEYLRRHHTWHITRILQSPLKQSGDEFGAAIALDGDRLMVSAPGDPIDGQPGGQVWIYTRVQDELRIESVLSPIDPAPGMSFGHAIALRGDLAVVGTPCFDLDQNWDNGRVEIHRRVAGGWQREAVLDPPHPATSTRFGWSVAIASDAQHVLIGAPGVDAPEDRAGAVYVASSSHGGNWTLSSPLHGINPRALDRFGSAVETDRNLAIIGAEGADGGAENSGAIAVATITEHPRILAQLMEPAESGGRLGTTIAAAANRFAATIPGHRATKNLRGRVRIFTSTSMGFLPTLDIDPGPGVPPLGASIAIDEEHVLVTAIADQDGIPEPGRAWLIPLKRIEHGLSKSPR